VNENSPSAALPPVCAESLWLSGLHSLQLSGEAAPRNGQGVASPDIKRRLTERQSLSAQKGGTAAHVEPLSYIEPLSESPSLTIKHTPFYHQPFT
jgi:hypothetical protein